MNHAVITYAIVGTNWAVSTSKNLTIRFPFVSLVLLIIDLYYKRVNGSESPYWILYIWQFNLQTG